MSMSTLLHIGWLSAALCACGGSGSGQGTPDAQGSDGGSGGPSACESPLPRLVRRFGGVARPGFGHGGRPSDTCASNRMRSRHARLADLLLAGGACSPARSFRAGSI